MKMLVVSLVVSLIIVTNIYAQIDDGWVKMVVGEVQTNGKGYRLLERLCDETGGRFIGSKGNYKGLEILSAALSDLGYAVRNEKIIIPGWVRGKDEVEMVTPVAKSLRIAALGYTDKTAEFTAPVVFIGHGYADDFAKYDVKDKIVVATQKPDAGKESLLRLEVISMASKAGAKGILFANDKQGGQLLCGTSDFNGNPSKIPAFSITFEEGEWIKRLSARSGEVNIRIKTESYCKQIETSNVVVTYNGMSKKKIVFGAHFDSWDLGQGGVDNGVGTAILFDIASALVNTEPYLDYSIEMVWFNGEELGLWGSRKYLEAHSNDTILAMVNMDMTGTPTGINVMGFDEYKPAMETFLTKFGSIEYKAGVISTPWTNSDHMHFMFEGIPTFTAQAKLDHEMTDYYHDFGDTFDKVSGKYISDAAQFMTSLAIELGSNAFYNKPNKSKEEIKKLLIKYGLDKRLKRQGEWQFN